MRIESSIKGIQVVRQLFVILLMPLYFLVSEKVAWQLSLTFSIWNYYTLAIFLPTIGLVSTYMVAPLHKMANTAIIFIFGLVLAYITICPAMYPESHKQAYQYTYVPFVITFLWATFIVGFLVCVDRRKKYNKRIKSDSVNSSSFLQKTAKKSPSLLRSLCER